MQLVIGNKNYSTWSLRPWLLLTHFDIHFDEHFIALFQDNMLDKMQDYCPNNKVPVLIDNQQKIWDSLAICEYINEQYLQGNGWPNEPQKRAIARAICAEMHSSFFSLREEMPMNCRRIPAKIALTSQAQQDIERIKDLWTECLSQHSGGYLFDQFSIADVFFMPVVVRFTIYQIPVSAKIQTYIDNMLSLPAYQLWLNDAINEKYVIEEEEV